MFEEDSKKEAMKQLQLRGITLFNDIVHYRTGRTVLIHAAINNDVTLVRLLLTARAAYYLPQKDGSTALHCASEEGYTDIVLMLVLCYYKMPPPSPYSIDDIIMTDKANRGMTALYLAAAKGYEQCVRALLLYNADVSRVSREGASSLKVATGGGHLACMRLLLEHRADPNQRDDQDYVPLHRANNLKNAECIALLKKYGAREPASVREEAITFYRAVSACNPVWIILAVEDYIKHRTSLMQKEKQAISALSNAVQQKVVMDIVKNKLIAFDFFSEMHLNGIVAEYVISERLHPLLVLLEENARPESGVRYRAKSRH